MARLTGALLASAPRNRGARGAERAKRTADGVVAARPDVSVVTGPGDFRDAIAIAHVGTSP